MSGHIVQKPIDVFDTYIVGGIRNSGMPLSFQFKFGQCGPLLNDFNDLIVNDCLELRYLEEKCHIIHREALEAVLVVSL